MPDHHLFLAVVSTFEQALIVCILPGLQGLYISRKTGLRVGRQAVKMALVGGPVTSVDSRGGGSGIPAGIGCKLTPVSACPFLTEKRNV